jgi:hypothetical protein
MAGKTRATNIQKVTHYMNRGPNLQQLCINQAFVMEAISRYAKDVIKNDTLIRRTMANSPIHPEAWIEAAKQWQQQNPEYK